MKKSLLAGLPGLLLAAGLAGCDQGFQELDELPGVQLHEPGRYLGKPDPLLEQSGSPELANQLAERLERVQTDR